MPAGSTWSSSATPLSGFARFRACRTRTRSDGKPRPRSCRWCRGLTCSISSRGNGRIPRLCAGRSQVRPSRRCPCSKGCSRCIWGSIRSGCRDCLRLWALSAWPGPESRRFRRCCRGIMTSRCSFGWAGTWGRKSMIGRTRSIIGGIGWKRRCLRIRSLPGGKWVWFLLRCSSFSPFTNRRSIWKGRVP